MNTARLPLCVSALCILGSLSLTRNAAANQTPYVTPPYTCSINYYVSPTGSDTNAGTNSAPWKTLSHAIAILSPSSSNAGVCVNAAPGTYTESLYLGHLNGQSDDPNGYLVFRSSTPHGAILQEPLGNIATYSGNVVIQYSHHVIFDGFTVAGYANVPMAGANAYQAFRSHHIKFLNNIIHDVGGAGIAVIYSDYVAAQGNIVYNTACCNSSGTSAIDYYEPVPTDGDPGYHNVISNNVVYNNAEGPDGRNPHSEGHGIMMDSFRLGPSGSYTMDTLIENNLSFGNGGAGINVYASDCVTIRNNTVYNNFRDPLIGYAGGDIMVMNSSYVIGVNNIAVTNTSANGNLLSIWDQTTDRTNIGNVWKNNVTFNGNPGDPSVSTYNLSGTGTAITEDNGNILGQDPLFADPSIYNFRIQAGSPAAGNGTDFAGVPAVDLLGRVRSTTAIDIGALAVHVAKPK